MNTRTLKTAGAAALGVAFAAVAAGPAVASPVDTVLKQLPLERAVQSVPGATQAVGVTKNTLGYTTATAARTLPAATQGLPGKGLLPGGNTLPTDNITKVLPKTGLPLL
jgi:hypothetical protein